MIPRNLGIGVGRVYPIYHSTKKKTETKEKLQVANTHAAVAYKIKNMKRVYRTICQKKSDFPIQFHYYRFDGTATRVTYIDVRFRFFFLRLDMEEFTCMNFM